MRKLRGEKMTCKSCREKAIARAKKRKKELEEKRKKALLDSKQGGKRD